MLICGVFSCEHLRSRKQNGHQAHPHAQCLALNWVCKTLVSDIIQTHTGPLNQGYYEVHHLEKGQIEHK